MQWRGKQPGVGTESWGGREWSPATAPAEWGSGACAEESQAPAALPGREEGGLRTQGACLPACLPPYCSASPAVPCREIDGHVFVELDVGSEGNVDEDQIREVLLSIIEGGSIASYVTSAQGFQFRRLGAGEAGLGQTVRVGQGV